MRAIAPGTQDAPSRTYWLALEATQCYRKAACRDTTQLAFRGQRRKNHPTKPGINIKNDTTTATGLDKEPPPPPPRIRASNHRKVT